MSKLTEAVMLNQINEYEYLDEYHPGLDDEWEYDNETPNADS